MTDNEPPEYCENADTATGRDRLRRGFDLIRDAYAVEGLDAHQRAVLVLLAFMANEEAGNTAWPSIAYMVEKLGISERSVQRAITTLTADGAISRKQRRHATAVYTVHPHLHRRSKPVSVTPVSVTPVSVTPVTDDGKTRQPDTLIAKNNHIPTKASPSSGTRARERATGYPADFMPVMSGKTASVVAGWPPGKLDDEIEKFRDWHAANGTRSHDWQASWRTWVSKSEAFRRDREDEQRSRNSRSSRADGTGSAYAAARDNVRAIR